MKLKKLIPTLLIPLTLGMSSCIYDEEYKTEYITPKTQKLDLTLIDAGDEIYVLKIYHYDRYMFSYITNNSEFEFVPYVLSLKYNNANNSDVLSDYTHVDSLKMLFNFAYGNSEIKKVKK